MNVLLAGGTGLIGSHLLQLLVADSDVSGITAYTRSPLSQTHSKLCASEWGAADKVNADIAFCALGTTIKQAGSKEAFKAVDYDLVLRFAEKAKVAGVKHFLCVTAIGSSPSSSVFYSRIKGEVEGALQACNFEQLSIFQPSMLIGRRADNRLGEQLGGLLMTLVNPLMLGPVNKYHSIYGEDVAAAMLRQSKNDKAGKCQRLRYRDMVDVS